MNYNGSTPSINNTALRSRRGNSRVAQETETLYGNDNEVTVKPTKKKTPDDGSGEWVSFGWVRWITIILTFLWVILYIVAIVTASQFPECSSDEDCLGDVYTCLSNGRCSCTYADFTPDSYTGYRPYRCDPAGLAFHVDPVMLSVRTVFFVSLIWILFIDLDLTRYLAHSETIQYLNRKVYRIECLLTKEYGNLDLVDDA